MDLVPEGSDLVLALVHNEEAAMFRRYREIGRGPDGALIVELIPLNPDYRTIRSSPNSPIEILGVARKIDRSTVIR